MLSVCHPSERKTLEGQALPVSVTAVHTVLRKHSSNELVSLSAETS